MRSFPLFSLVTALLSSAEGIFGPGPKDRPPRAFKLQLAGKLAVGITLAQQVARKPVVGIKWSAKIYPILAVLDQVQVHPTTGVALEIAKWSFLNMFIFRATDSLAKQVLKFSELKSLLHMRALKATDDNTKFLKAVQLALAKCDMYQHRGFGQLDVYEWTGRNQSTAAAYPNLQVLVVSSEFLKKARRLPCGVTAATIAHEFGHMRKHHCRHMGDFVAFTVISSGWFIKRLSRSPKLCYSLIALGFLRLECGLSNSMSQLHEYEADAYASEAMGEDNMVLTLQTMHDIPIPVISLQHALGVILIPASYFRESKDSLDTLSEQARGRLSFVKRVKILFRSGGKFWIPRFGDLTTHPTTEHRMLMLHERKRTRRSKEARARTNRIAFLNT